LSALESESAPPASSAEIATLTEAPSGGSGRSIREFLGEIAARRPRGNGSSEGEAAQPQATTDGGELPFLTDLPEPNAPSASASADSRIPELPELTSEAAGIAQSSLPPSNQQQESSRRPSASVSGSLGSLFAEAEAPGAAAAGADTTGEHRAESADARPRGDSTSHGGATDEHSPLPGRPTQPAVTELSLDYVFRHVTPAAGTPGQPNFSFDQFFSQEAQQDAATSGGEPSREPTTDESDDIQQFNAWLEGLKKS
jgi:hypothetical protein